MGEVELMIRFFKRQVPPNQADPNRVTLLADYNGRVGRGIVHTPEYVERMRREQEWFDERERTRETPSALSRWSVLGTFPTELPKQPRNPTPATWKCNWKG